jgi:hypothetical protein
MNDNELPKIVTAKHGSVLREQGPESGIYLSIFLIVLLHCSRGACIRFDVLLYFHDSVAGLFD